MDGRCDYVYVGWGRRRRWWWWWFRLIDIRRVNDSFSCLLLLLRGKLKRNCEYFYILDKSEGLDCVSFKYVYKIGAYSVKTFFII